MKNYFVILITILTICGCEKTKFHIDQLKESDLQKYSGRQVNYFLDNIDDNYTSYIFTHEPPGIISGCKFTYKHNFIYIYIITEGQNLHKIFKVMEPWSWKIDDFINLRIKSIEIRERTANNAINKELIIAWIKYQNIEVSSDNSSRYLWASSELDFRIENDPEIAWPLILNIFETDKSDIIMEQLSKGPLLDFVAAHGEEYIDLIEKQAQKDSDFAVLLGGLYNAVDKDKISGDLRKRIQGVWNLKGWGGHPVRRIKK